MCRMCVGVVCVCRSGCVLCVTAAVDYLLLGTAETKFWPVTFLSYDLTHTSVSTSTFISWQPGDGRRNRYHEQSAVSLLDFV